MNDGREDAQKKPPPSRLLTPELDAEIAANLKRAFDDVAKEPIPDDLLRLLDDLAKKDKRDN